MANYFDNGHIDGRQLTPQQIADAIRHKKFGVDVREAMAQGLEYCMTQAQKVDKLEQDLSNLDKRVTSLETLPSEVAEIKQDIETINQNIETIDKRVTSLETLPSEVAEVKRDIGTINQNIETIDKRVTSLETLPSEVAEVKRDIGTINKQIDKLNVAVFGDGAVPIDTPIDLKDQTNKAQEVHLD